MSTGQLEQLAENLADDINVTQARNRRARESHERRRIRELKERGIDPSALVCCDVKVAL